MIHKKLREAINNNFRSNKAFAKELGICRQALANKLNGKVSFMASEIKRICEILKIKGKDIPSYFLEEISNG